MVCAGFALLTAVMTWPQIAQPTGILPHPDSWFNLWRLAWVAHQLPRDPAHLFDANIFFPERGTLAYSDAVILQGLLGAPLHWMGVSPPAVGAVLVLGSFVFAAMSAFWLVRYLTTNSASGILAGVVFAFTPYRFDHYMHLEMLWSGWMPLVLLALHRALEGSTRAGVAAGLLLAAQVFTCIYYGVFFVPVITTMAVVLVWGSSLPALKRATPSLVVGAALAALLVLPYFAPYWQARDLVGPREEAERHFFSAGPRHYLSATPENVLYGRLTAGMGRPEKRLFPGAVALALTVVALWPPLDRRRCAYLAGLLLAIDLSFGPRGLTRVVTDHLFLFEGLRAPARAGQISLLMVAILAGYGLARLRHCWPRPAAWRVAASLITAVAIAEYAHAPLPLVPAPTAASPFHRWLAEQPSAAIAQLPMPELSRGLPLHDDQFSYESVFHWQRLANGYSGSFPASYTTLLVAMRTFPSTDALDALRRTGLTHLSVHERFYGAARYRAIVGALASRSDLAGAGPFQDGEFEVMAYRFLKAEGP